MFVKLLGLIDIICAVALALMFWNIGKFLAIVCAAYLVVKSLRYLFDVASFVDLAAGIFLLATAFGVYPFFNWFFVVWLLQKGVRSLF